MAAITVPTLDGPQVTSRAVSGGEQQANTTPDMFGAAQGRLAGQASQALNRASQAATSIFEQKRDEAETIQLLEVERELDTVEDGYREARNKALLGGAQNLTTNTLADYDTQSQRILDRYKGNARMTQRIGQHVLARRRRIRSTSASHEDAEVKKYKTALIADKVERAKEASISGYDPNLPSNDQRIHSQSMRELEKTVRDLAALEGFDPTKKEDKAVIDKRVRDARSEVHEKIIKGMIDAGDGTAAREYFTEHRNEIDADNVSANDASTKKASVDEAAEALAVTAFRTAKNPTAQFAAIDKSKASIEVKDEARKRLKERITISKADEAYQTSEAEKRAANLAQQGKEPTSEETQWLSGPKVETYKKIAQDQRYKNANPNWAAVIPDKTVREAKEEVDVLWENGKLAEMTSDQFKAKFGRRLPDKEYDAALNNWRIARGNAAKADAQAQKDQAIKDARWKGEFTQATMINNYMRDKMRWKPGNPKRVAYREAVSDELREMTEANNGKALTTDQVNKLLTRMVIEIDTPGWGRTPVYERPKIEGVPQNLVDDYAAKLQEAIKDPNNRTYYKKDLTPELIQQFHLAVEYARSGY